MSLGRFLVKANNITGKVTKSRSYFRCIHPYRLHNFTSIGNHCLKSRSNVVNQNID